MKWFISILFVLCLCGFAYGETVTVTWDGPELSNNWDNVIGFDLRVNEIDMISVVGADTREWSGDVTLVEGTNVFDMRAKNLSGNMSIWSEPAYYNYDSGIIFPPCGINIVLGCAVPVSQIDWILHYVDSEESISEDGAAINAFDGNSTTRWHTVYTGDNDPVHPHEIVIDLGCNRQVCSFSYLPRQDEHYYGGVAAYELYMSIDDQNWSDPVAVGVFPCTHDKQRISFNVKSARYIRFVALSDVTGHAATCVAEIELWEWIE